MKPVRMPTRSEIAKLLALAVALVVVVLIVAVAAASGKAREAESKLQTANTRAAELELGLRAAKKELATTTERVTELESEMDRLRRDLAAAGPAPVALMAPRDLAEAPAPPRPAAVAAPSAGAVAEKTAAVRAAERAAAEARRAAQAAAEERRRLAALIPRYRLEARGMHSGLMTRDGEALRSFNPVGVWSVPQDDTVNSPTAAFMYVYEDGGLMMLRATDCSLIDRARWEIDYLYFRIHDRDGSTTEQIIMGVPGRFVLMEDETVVPQIGQRLFFDSNRYWSYVSPNVDADC